MVMAPEGVVQHHSAPRRVLRSGQLTPERLPVEIGGDNPRTLHGWVVNNVRYPASIEGELQDAREDFQATRALVQPEDAPPVPKLLEAVEALIEHHDSGGALERLTEDIQVLRQAVELQKKPLYRTRAVEWEAHVTRLLCILIPGLEEHEADMLDSRMEWLQELGYFRPQAAGLQPEATEQRPPEPGPSSIGAEHGPDSDGSTE